MVWIWSRFGRCGGGSEDVKALEGEDLRGAKYLYLKDLCYDTI